MSASMPMTRPRPYLSWLTRSCSAKHSTGGSGGGGANGLVGRCRLLPLRCDRMVLSVCAFTSPFGAFLPARDWKRLVSRGPDGAHVISSARASTSLYVHIKFALAVHGVMVAGAWLGARMSKNIVICLDGTGNQLKARGNTNVVCAYELLDLADPSRQ